MEEKEAIPNERNADPQRGWSYVGSEKTSKLNMVDKDGQAPQDLEDEKVSVVVSLRAGSSTDMLAFHQEHFDFCRAEDTQFPSKWPSESSIPGFRGFMETFLETCHKVGMDIMRVLEQGLEVPPGELVDRFSTKVDEVRLNHYSPLPTERLSDGKHQRSWPHTDFGMLTLLFQDEAGGLEVEDRAHPGSFIPVQRESPTEMSVYVSDTLEHLTNDHLRAGVHQVVTPVGIDGRASGVLPERYSIACFLKADRQTSVGPLDNFVTAERPRAYGDMTALDLHRKRVGQLYLDA